MRVSVRSVTVSRLAIAAAISLCGAGSAWAGGGGEDLGTVQTVLNGACQFTLGMTSCPQLPTITQLVLTLSGLENLPPDFQRGNLAVCTVPGSPPPCAAIAVNAVNPPAPSSEDLPSNLTPLAFISPPSTSPLAIPGQAVPVPLGTAGANSFFSAVTTGQNGQPRTLNVVYDYPPWTNQWLPKGVVANLSLPLQVLNADGSERLVCGPQKCPASLATMQISANCSDPEDCLSAVVMGDFSKPGKTETRSAAELGINFKLEFGSSPNSTRSHAMLIVQAPLLVTGVAPLANPTKCGANINDMLNSGTPTPDPKDCGNDPAYFGVDGTGNPGTGFPTFVNQKSGLPTAFSTNDLGVTPRFLGKPVGIAPYAAPPCVGGLCDPAQPPQKSTFGFCASLLADPSKGGTSTLHPAVAAQLAIGTEGATYVSAARIPQPPQSPPPPPPPTCPF